MDPFKTTSKLSVTTIIFGVLTLIFGWLVTETGSRLVQLQLGEIALVFLSLFFYSLVSDRISTIEETECIQGKGRTNEKPGP